MGAISDTLVTIIRSIGGVTSNSVMLIKIVLGASPVLGVIFVLSTLTVLGSMKLAPVSLSLIAAVLTSAPFQVLVSRVILDALFLETFIPIPGTMISSTTLCTVCSIVLYDELTRMFTIKTSLAATIATPMVALAYIFTAAHSAVSWARPELIARRVAIPWTLFVISFIVSLMITEAGQAYLIASATLVFTMLLSFIDVVQGVSRVSRISIFTRSNLLTKSLKIAIAAFADYSLMMMSSIAYYLMMFFDKFLIWSKYGFPYFPLDSPSFIGMIPLFAGTLAAIRFWDSVEGKLDLLYRVDWDGMYALREFVMKAYWRSLAWTLVLAGLITASIMLAIGISAHQALGYISMAVLGVLSFFMGLGAVKLPGKYSIMSLLTATGALFLKVNVQSVSVLTTYLIGSLSGAIIVYTYPQLLTFRRDFEALLVTFAVPATELLAWKYFGEGFLPMSYLMGATFAAGLSLIFSIRMYRRISREVYRVVAYNAFVSYVTEIPRRWG